VVTVTNGFGCARSSDTSFVVILATPVVSITQSGQTLVASAGSSYQWYLNGQIILGAIASTYTPTMTGNYTVYVENGAGCGAISPPYSFAVGLEDEALASGLVIFPNPTDGTATLRFTPNRPGTLTTRLVDLQGRVVWHTELKSQAGPAEIELPMRDLPAGAYFLQLQGRGQQVVRLVSKL
jgi:Secretion system C-terminal sorting domain